MLPFERLNTGDLIILHQITSKVNSFFQKNINISILHNKLHYIYSKMTQITVKKDIAAYNSNILNAYLLQYLSK